MDALVVTRTSKSFAQTLADLRAAAAARGVQELGFVDHAEGARSAGLTIPEETVLLLGNPQVGTAVMTADPRAGLDLPMRVLVRQTPSGAELVHRDPRRLADDFAVAEATETLDRLADVALALVTEAAEPKD